MDLHVDRVPFGVLDREAAERGVELASLVGGHLGALDGPLGLVVLFERVLLAATDLLSGSREEAQDPGGVFVSMVDSSRVGVAALLVEADRVSGRHVRLELCILPRTRPDGVGAEQETLRLYGTGSHQLDALG